MSCTARTSKNGTNDTEGRTIDHGYVLRRRLGCGPQRHRPDRRGWRVAGPRPGRATTRPDSRHCWPCSPDTAIPPTTQSRWRSRPPGAADLFMPGPGQFRTAFIQGKRHWLMAAHSTLNAAEVAVTGARFVGELERCLTPCPLGRRRAVDCAEPQASGWAYVPESGLPSPTEILPYQPVIFSAAG